MGKFQGFVWKMRRLTLYSALPSTDTQVANKAYVDQQVSNIVSGDIAFLAKKEFEGEVITDEGTLSVAGTLCTITAPASHDLYLAKAKWSCALEQSLTQGSAIVELRVNGVVKATVRAFLSDTSIGDNGANSVFEYEFAIAGLKVLAGEVIIIEATTVEVNIEVNGEIIGWSVATGLDPT